MKKYLRFGDSPRRMSKVTSYLSVQFGIDLQIKRKKRALWGRNLWCLMLGVVPSSSPTEAAAALCPEVQPHQGQARILNRHILHIYTKRKHSTGKHNQQQTVILFPLLAKQDERPLMEQKYRWIPPEARLRHPGSPCTSGQFTQ